MCEHCPDVNCNGRCSSSYVVAALKPVLGSFQEGLKELTTDLKCVSKKADDNKSDIQGLSDKIQTIETQSATEKTEAFEARMETNRLLTKTKDSVEFLYKQNLNLHIRANTSERKALIG